MAHFNDGKHLVAIIDRQECKKHNALLGLPCFLIRKSKGNGYYAAICNRRAVSAGANGKVSESSFQVKRREYKEAKKSSKS